MDLLTFISAISWPVVFFIVVLMFRKLIVQRLKSFEGFGLKVDMVEEQKQLIENPSKVVTDHRALSRQVVSSHFNAEGDIGYALYSNGILIQKLKITISDLNRFRDTPVHFPIAFPIMVLNVQFIGGSTPDVIEMNRGSITLRFTNHKPSHDTELINIIVVGL
ncbi:TPA: hypothetical protein ND652_004667 [Klebsiella aerogenes]|uniref:hypothetical protein n=1 Tax=Klebsiella aerogenes TaxID=548 RepID=UPI00293178EE|nr:hypothetical protein [Klebsiella aerogenes]HBQ7963160.1 hypothetical protein [Klebsiella aerogenes]HCD8032600.1 hypothetical protein [Klebsiella aerogenes]HED2521385.1 hypothetical protein [Klebsiella aerogenes]HED2526515.1 hypothetical protein [Klebsiella aerogenes]